MNDEKLQLYETIDQYLSGELTGEALAAFKERLGRDTDLQAEVELHRQIDEVLSDTLKLEFVEKLQHLREKHSTEASDDAQKKTSGFGRYRNLLTIAASIILLIGIGALVYLFRPQGPNFRANAELDAQLGDMKENDGVTLILEDQSKKPVFRIDENGVIDFQVEGRVSAPGLTANDKLTATIYDNQYQQPETPDGGTYALAVDIILPPNQGEGFAFGEDTAFPFIIEQEIDLDPGLYYYVISLEGNEQGLFTGKFKVKD